MKEISMLQWMDKKKGNILFTDIAVPGFDAVETTGLTMDDLMAEIYGRLPSGELVKGMEVFRQLYGAVGLGALFAPTAWRPLRPLFDAIYTGFAKNRLRMTGRCTDEVCATAPQ
jgi:predicted DCC family thiol-disulfide oxidoreductase YuxK